MSSILKLDPSVDLWLSYTWSNINHGICGHTFEVIDYYYILKKHFKVGILIGEDMDWKMFESSIRSKYSFTEAEILEFKANTVFHKNPKLIVGSNILFTDGGIVNLKNVTLLVKNVFLFACGNKTIKDNKKLNWYILQDDRVYEPVSVNGINYKKRILFDKLKVINSSKDQMLVYATKNCRNLDDYQDLRQYSDKLLVITNEENKPEPADGFEFVTPPIENLFEQFTTYIYTPVIRQWDCSPRFIAECKYYGKDVIFHNINYWDTDNGLRVRQWDIDNDFDSLYLRSDDNIINILKDII
jgi:hypothetical protein